LKTGDKLEVKGPFVKIQYSPNWKKNVGMLAGGTGITPMFQIIKEALENPADKTNYTLVFANISEEDILLKHELDQLAAAHSNFKVHYVLEKPPAGWTGSVGYITADTIKQFMPAASDAESIVLVCGPPPMMKAISGDKKSPQDQGELVGILKDLGYNSAGVFKF
jgi:cytochrome-b5 reductase